MRLLILSFLFFASCSIPSRTTLRGAGGRGSYNEAIQNTSREQMLLNLVRLRYCDTPFFLDVNSVTTSFSYGAKTTQSLPIPGFNNANPFILGGELSWSNTPTIQYSPLEGKQFAVQLLQPIDLIVIQGLIYSGWDIDRVLKLTVQRLGDLINAPNASGPTPITVPHYKRFFRAAELLRTFQENDELQIGVLVKKNSVNGKDNEEGIDYDGTGLQISFPDTCEEACELATLLGVKKHEGKRYYVELSVGYSQESQHGVNSRSILACMYYMSLGIEVPLWDITNQSVIVTKTKDGNLFNWNEVLGNLFQIKWCEDYPENAYVAVKYRNYWFYIDDFDSASKRTFVLLMQLYSLQSGESKAQGPVLTIPVGI
ncbi:MAG: hypothetical protein ChlgKO_08930 [Chlamydiales bacterium]